MQKMGNNGDHRRQEVIEYYSRFGKSLELLTDALRTAIKAFSQFYKAIPKEIKRKGKYRQN